jgi:hypothetical protein
MLISELIILCVFVETLRQCVTVIIEIFKSRMVIHSLKMSSFR